MKITREELLQITKEELQKVVAEAKISFKKTGKEQSTQWSKGTTMGSKANPCAKPGSGAYGVGQRLFDPHDMSRPNPAEWECNTKIEDQLHDAISSFIAFNSPGKILGRVGEFILKYFKNKTDKKLPIHKFAVDKPLYRGSARKFNAYGFDFLERVQWDQGVEHSKKITRFPFDGVYQLRRPVSSFSDSFNSAVDFMQTNDTKDCVFMYETSGVTETANGGFFLDLDGMYNLQANPDYSMSDDGKIRFQDVSSFWHENEVLLIGNGKGDSIAVDYVYINTDHLNKNLNKLKQLRPDLAEKIRANVGFGDLKLKQARSQLKREMGYLKDIVEDVLPKYQSGEKKNPAGIDNLIRRIRGRVTAYSKNEDLYIAAGMEKEYKEFMAGMSKLFRDLQNLKAPPKEWGSGKFDPTTIPDPSPFGGNLE